MCLGGHSLESRCLLSSFFVHFILLTSCAGLGPGPFEELQHISISQGRAVRARKAKKQTVKWSRKERKIEWYWCYKSREREGNCLAGVDHFLMLGIPSGQYLCFEGLRYLWVGQEKFYTRLFQPPVWSGLYEKYFGEDFSSHALYQKCFWDNVKSESFCFETINLTCTCLIHTMMLMSQVLSCYAHIIREIFGFSLVKPRKCCKSLKNFQAFLSLWLENKMSEATEMFNRYQSSLFFGNASTLRALFRFFSAQFRWKSSGTWLSRWINTKSIFRDLDFWPCIEIHVWYVMEGCESLIRNKRARESSGHAECVAQILSARLSRSLAKLSAPTNQKPSPSSHLLQEALTLHGTSWCGWSLK